ncbi:hypothetical protein L2E82_31283 [Cichorium intybus]|uniref:Uncharacterized protein n=1 Tax=Cichorium intybus TaxID=13427 RepID=A0ACB9D2L6_CICIN|nr:hypothetical protein L2E82_31283 [Cichorium intybus]
MTSRRLLSPRLLNELLEAKLEGIRSGTITREQRKLFVLMQKLKAIKEKIKLWKKEKDRRSQEEQKQWLNRIEMIDKIIEEEKGSELLFKERLEITSKIRKK